VQAVLEAYVGMPYALHTCILYVEEFWKELAYGLPIDRRGSWGIDASTWRPQHCSSGVTWVL